MAALHVECASLLSTSRFSTHKRARLVADALLIESWASVAVSCAVCYMANVTRHVRNPCITIPLLPTCVAYRIGTTRATAVRSCGYRLIFVVGTYFLLSFLLSLSPCTTPTSQLGLKTRCLKQYTTRKAITARCESGARVVCFMDRTAFVLHPNAAHREDGATHTTTTSFDMRFAVRASLLTVCLLRMTRTAPHRHTHSHSALLVYPRAHRSTARVQHIAHADADTLTQSRANNIVTVPTTKCRITPSPTRIDSIAPFSTDHVSCTDAAREGGGGH